MDTTTCAGTQTSDKHRDNTHDACPHEHFLECVLLNVITVKFTAEIFCFVLFDTSVGSPLLRGQRTACRHHRNIDTSCDVCCGCTWDNARRRCASHTIPLEVSSPSPNFPFSLPARCCCTSNSSKVEERLRKDQRDSEHAMEIEGKRSPCVDADRPTPAEACVRRTSGCVILLVASSVR